VNLENLYLDIYLSVKKGIISEIKLNTDQIGNTRFNQLRKMLLQQPYKKDIIKNIFYEWRITEPESILNAFFS
jgi:hypothetical protein